MTAIRWGGLLWLLSVQNLVVEFVAAAAWERPYSFRENAISDLGNTECAPFEGRDVCSPLHELFNASQVAFGLTMIVAALLTLRWLPPGAAGKVAVVFLVLSGVGVAGAALVPENVDLGLHDLSALVAFTGQNVALLLLAVSVRSVLGGYAVFTLLCGVVGLVATAMLVVGEYAGLGFGGMERVAANPFLLWAVVTGLLMLAGRSPRRSAGVSS